MREFCLTFWKQVKLIVFLLFLFIAFSACNKEKKEYVDTPFDREKLPSMATDSVTELISDSGLIKYKMIADKWLVFDNAADPYWFFPEGIYLEQFDTTFQIEAVLKADTAWNYTQKKLWKLKGHVFIYNTLNETFKSEELFWNERTGQVYSDKYIEIVRPEKLTLKGIGFESNQQMTNYRIFRPYDSDMYFEEENAENSADSLSGSPPNMAPPRVNTSASVIPADGKVVSK
ncbi:MAG: LPS export ABC transporter periplasmic protein LptC [Dysgonomonas sp.]